MTMDQCYKLRFRTTIWNTYNRETRSNTLPSSGGTRSKTTPSSKAGISKVKNVKWGKPCYSYACLIALAIKSSNNCAVPIDQIYCFICEHFPYYQTVDAQWKKDIMHDLYKSEFFIEERGLYVRHTVWKIIASKISFFKVSYELLVIKIH